MELVSPEYIENETKKATRNVIETIKKTPCNSIIVFGRWRV